ncbi:sap domain-containing protein, partial [Colletotrichum incanum]
LSSCEPKQQRRASKIVITPDDPSTTALSLRLPSSTSLPPSISSLQLTAHPLSTSSHRSPTTIFNNHLLPPLDRTVANMATDYSSLKVPELKKLLQERGLPATGNKLDLVNRLKENDKQAAPATAEEDEIDYSDDEPAPVKAADASKPAAVEAAPVADESAPAPAPAAAEPTAPATDAAPEAAPEAETTGDEEKKPEEAAETADEAPKENFALNLDATDAAAEAKKRADRAKRFGIDEDEEAKKKAERAKKFGIEVGSVAGLDSALPERRPKRGRPERAEEQPGRDSKRQSTDGRGRRGRGNRNGRPGGRQGGGGGGGGDREPRRSAAVDPAEKARLEARAKRFAA